MKSKMLAVLFATLIALPMAASAGDYVRGYTKRDGTYVAPHYRSAPDSIRYNNRGAQTYGGTQRDEFSSGTGATNKSNSTYGWRDNDRDGVYNPYDRSPDVKRRW